MQVQFQLCRIRMQSKQPCVKRSFYKNQTVENVQKIFSLLNCCKLNLANMVSFYEITTSFQFITFARSDLHLNQRLLDIKGQYDDSHVGNQIFGFLFTISKLKEKRKTFCCQFFLFGPSSTSNSLSLIFL